MHKRILKYSALPPGPWRPAPGWRFRHARCAHCGHEWWEIVEPALYATTDSSCACNQGEPWGPEDSDA